MKLIGSDLTTVATLSDNELFQRFMRVLERELESADKSLRVATPETVQRVQGRAILLHEIIRDVSSAKNDIAKL